VAGLKTKKISFVTFITQDMRYLIVALLFVSGFVYAKKPCPSWGNAREGTLAYSLSIKKNRVDIPKDYKKISIIDFLKFPDDSVGDGVAYEMTGGVLLDVKKQGPETCNCKDKAAPDFHIVVVPNPGDAGDKSKYVIVEVTPRIKKMFNWTDQDILSLKNNFVDFYGYKFADLEHKNMSVKSNPKRKTCWRGSINEIHPVTKFVIRNQQ
jgi:hypothetical protein